MKRILGLLTIVVISVSLLSCSKKENNLEPIKWEYKTLNCTGDNVTEFYSNIFTTGSEKMSQKLAQLGQEGWELVEIYTTNETVYPNFGNAKYVTGLQPNTRTKDIVYVFKRQCIEGRSNDNPYEEMSVFPKKEAEAAEEAPAAEAAAEKV